MPALIVTPHFGRYYASGQELFPVFLLNLECPSDEVDVLTEPDKTSVEFADWPNAKNAVIAMLLVRVKIME